MNKSAKIAFCCKESNDLLKVFNNCGYSAKNDTDLKKLISEMDNDSAILVLCDSYPIQNPKFSEDILDLAKEKNIRLYVEYENGTPKATVSERVVVADDFFGELKKGSILMANDIYYLPMEKKDNVHLYICKVAGYDRIAFEMPEEKYPVLFEEGDVLFAATCFSNFVTARFSPADSLVVFWKHIFSWLTKGEFAPSLDYELSVGATYKENEEMIKGYEMRAAQRTYNWFERYMLSQEEFGIGVLEGTMSKIQANGSQRLHSVMRADCILESALLFALEGKINANPKATEICKNILEYGFSKEFYNDDENTPEYGFINWFKSKKTFYGDDNARALLAALCIRNITGDTDYDEKILTCLLANLRTSNENGFKERLITAEELSAKGWKYYYNLKEEFSLRPHFQCYLWACFIWGYMLTGYKEFLDKAKSGIRITMEGFTDKWVWTNSLSAEIARMILPLAFLIKVEDTPEHRLWLKKVIDELNAHIVDCGAVEDFIGDLSMGTYPPPQSNEDFGSGEASLIQNNGDTATDLLYTTNWAFLGLFEAANVTGDKEIEALCDKMAEFLCRIQITSKAHPELDGAWMRSFDFKKWEYFGSSADRDWGAWCIETGWTNAWIASVLYMRNAGITLLNFKCGECFNANTNEIINKMMKL